MIRPEHLSYFKDLFEGRAAVSWRAWFKQNEAQLAQDLPRANFLRLKFHMLDEAEKILRQAGIEFTVSPSAKREKFHSLHHDSVLDERGRLDESFRRNSCDGAVGQFLDGDPAAAKETLVAFLRKIERLPREQRIEALQDMCSGGELDFEYGDREFGRMTLELVAALETGDDFLDPSIFRAREVLRKDAG